MSDNPPANSLATATSPYLQSAAHQPVHWQEWSDAAFERAAREDKPILLDIGAVWCHWCHVMDRESYESVEVARLINEHYIPVKVDRDERPDIDARYQLAVSALTGQGGWPLTAFLTADGKPFYGGTYFPPDDMAGRPGMKRVLATIASNYQTHRTQILASADQISEALGKVEKFAGAGEELKASAVGAILENIARLFDPLHGGFGSQPKFPHPGALDLLIESYLETGHQHFLDMVTTTLEHMGRGGVYDQIGGGFHRYSVDERWIVPHFEKMSYDNAGLLGNYLRAYQVTKIEFFREMALGILGFVESVLSDPGGGFYASQDADYSLEDDGDYFTWTLDEVKSALTAQEAEVVAQRYHVEPVGEMHHNPAKNVLFIDQPFEAIGARLKLAPEDVEKILAGAKAKILAARANRPTPFVDPTLYTSWNGQMVSALLEAYKILGLEGVRDRALATLDLFLEKTFDPAKGVYHSLVNGSPRIEGLLDDQVLFANALIDGFEVTGQRLYFDRALELMEIAIRRFWDDEHGGFFDTAKNLAERQGSLAMTRKPFQDSPTPAANSVAAMALDRLASLADRPDLRDKARATLSLFADKAGDYGLHAASYGLALSQHLRPPVEIVVVGARADERTRNLLTAAYESTCAGKRVLAFEPAAVRAGALPPALAVTLPNLNLDGKSLALVCVGRSCQPPVETPEDLARTLTAVTHHG